MWVLMGLGMLLIMKRFMWHLGMYNNIFWYQIDVNIAFCNLRKLGQQEQRRINLEFLILGTGCAVSALIRSSDFVMAFWTNFCQFLFKYSS